MDLQCTTTIERIHLNTLNGLISNNGQRSLKLPPCGGTHYNNVLGGPWCRRAVSCLLVWGIVDSGLNTEAIAKNCNVEIYYEGTQDLSGSSLRSKLHDIIQRQKSLTYPEVWDALKILDAADMEDPISSKDIIEIYSLRKAPKELAGKLNGWNREHLWPRSYGLIQGSPEFTDLHNLRPADTNVNSSRRNKYFGDCTVHSVGECLVPANQEAARDTATDRKTWRPPAEVRGDIARAMLYMAVRYSSLLKLSDSPSMGNSEMGLLSILLKWNEYDPPSPSERLRNERVCELYQHNRNPFVDHPEFARRLWEGF